MSKTKPKTAKSAPPARRSFNWQEFKLLLGREVSGASLSGLRIGIGLIMILEAYSLWKPNHGSISSGRSQLETYFTGADITFHFPFPLFSWVPLLPPTWIYVTVGLVAVSGLLVALGLFYRAAIITLLLSYGYLWVAESTRTYWQSYYYIEVLVVLFLAWMPAHRVFSLDAWRARQSGKEWPQILPFWPMFLLRAQLVIAYFYAGVAKLNKDWLLDAAPVRWFLAEPGVLGPYERFLSATQFQALKGFVESEGLAFFLSYTGLVFDLAVGFLFLFRRTRILALVLIICFHATNHFLIFDDIEWFPIVGIWTAFIFLDPDWPLRFAKWMRRPFVSRPDPNWFWPGLILIPGVGAALGWKMKEISRSVVRQPVSTRLAAVIAVWVVLQILIPLRHYAIAGDGRFTYEGMSFSWRLKTEVRRAVYHELNIVDGAVLKSGVSGAQVDWDRWRGDRAIYRQITPGKIDWERMPEIVVLLEPLIGERVMFNPHPQRIRSVAQAEERLNEIWTSLYGMAPENVSLAMAFPKVIGLMAQSLRNSGKVTEAERTTTLAQRTELMERGLLPQAEAGATRREIGALLTDVREKKLEGAELRRTAPFVLEGEFDAGVPFLVIEDPRIFNSTNRTEVSRTAWKSVNREPLAVHMGQVGSGARELLPQAYLLEGTDRVLRIRWNSAADLSASKMMHTSIQPFYLRRYARRVANLWQKQHGRRPSVHAETEMSLNARPHQELVDPQADLASVPAHWWRHNGWIRDLQTARIPRQALVPGKRI